MNKYHGKELLLWIDLMLREGGNKQELYWLLDILGGIEITLLNQLKNNPDRIFLLRSTLDQMRDVWMGYLRREIPLQYLVGKCYWRDFEVEISPDTLIPRPETELIVDFALDKIKGLSQGKWADLGTGSGVLAISMARELPDWHGFAVDCSQSALSIASSNLSRLAPNAKVSIELGDWWKPLKPIWGTIDLAISNPPYIPTMIFDELDYLVRENEPALALCGGIDGLEHCRKLVLGAAKGLAIGGWLIFEHHYDQSEKALELMKLNGFIDLETLHDLEGVRRFVIGRRS